MVLYRPHRRFLDEAMKEVSEVNSMPELARLLTPELKDGDKITVEKYGGFDERIGWDTYIVCINGQACGFTNGPLY